ncbi:BZ3500_MvSof-1268-A1-R1_Chr4-3g07415 [Microbotryum saponariae]|uniref:BZ3500_MvSof-1268-A1-R1_Chr4-3g07415 protein n=1 Tax=Microbotryum saponariae TaxID=289078 RepID=A0A2X0LP35_9BASI|nr:BZ3500_MvSof-1268-A1-R1_Chr4-3g07415 [Microbotryum saponariae]SDA07078.1 BZ3501_MvSof-1269-A2-R1_Chr4-2g07124 [Microbotryum saponariae]
MLCLHSRTDRSISRSAAWTFATGGTTRAATPVKAHEDGTSIAATDCCSQEDEDGRRLTFLEQPQIYD